MTINDVIVRNDECDLYHSLDGINHVLSKDRSLKGGSGIQDLDDYGNELKVPIFNVVTYSHGGQG